MKLLLAAVFIFTVSGTCHKTTKSGHSAGDAATSEKLAHGCYKARLEIKGICMNYVIKVLAGDMTALQLDRNWTDETDGKTYTNVFALGSRCSFPDMAEGDTFYFTIAPGEDTGCNVCMAFRPVPAAKNNIVVNKTACP